MNTVKDLLLNTLTANGFMYYPSMKRLMLKKEMSQVSEVMVIELEDQCRVYFSKSNSNNSLNEYTDDQKFNYDAASILSHIDMLLHGTETEFRTAA